jgi:hypothetical protein
MSGDESDRNAKQTDKKYFVLRPVWRSQEVTRWLHVIDLVYLSNRFAADGRATKGNWVRDRVRSTRVDKESKPIPGLPYNFYDQNWFGTLTPEEKQALRVGEEIDLSHSEEIIQRVQSDIRLLPRLTLHWVTVRRVTLGTHQSDGYQNPYKGTVRTPTAASGRGNWLQTAHLEPRRWGHFVRNSATLAS